MIGTITIIRLIASLKLGASAGDKIRQAADLLYDRNDSDKCKEGIRLLDSIGVGSKPKYGEEIICATVYYLKAMFYYSLNDLDDALFCLNVVEEVPSGRVFWGRSTLLEIKASAKGLEDEI